MTSKIQSWNPPRNVQKMASVLSLAFALANASCGAKLGPWQEHPNSSATLGISEISRSSHETPSSQDRMNLISSSRQNSSADVSEDLACAIGPLYTNDAEPVYWGCFKSCNDGSENFYSRNDVSKDSCDSGIFRAKAVDGPNLPYETKACTALYRVDTLHSFRSYRGCHILYGKPGHPSTEKFYSLDQIALDLCAECGAGL